MATPVSTKLAPEHLTFALQSLMTFAGAAEGSKTLQPEKVKEIHQKSGALLEQIEKGKMDPTKASVEVKKIIQEMNQSLPGNHPPYPPFVSDVVENQVKNNVIAFEHFLNHKLRSNKLTLEQEGPLFSDSLVLWRDIGSKLTAREGMHQLSKLILKANSYLSEKERFPIPEHSKY